MGIGKIDPEYAVREGWARDSDDEIYMDGYNAFIQVTTRDGTSGFQVKNDIGAVAFSSKSDGDGYVSKRLGVGAYFPQHELDVNGLAQVLGFKMPVNVTAGYVLMTDVDGVGTWQQVTLDTAINLDGYHPDSTGQEHYHQLSDAIQTILKELDGYGGGSGTDVKVKVSANDTTSGHLVDKLQGGKNISFDELNDGGNEVLSIKSSCYEDLTFEPTGYTNEVKSTMSWDDGTRTFTIAPKGDSFEYYIRGDGYSKTSPDSIVIPDVEGLWFIYYVGDTLTCGLTFWDLSIHVPTAVVYWDATNKKGIIFGEERHGLTMDWATHARLHLAVGTVKRRYTLDLVNYTLRGDGSQDSHAQVGYEDGAIHDEDIILDIVHSDTPSVAFEQYLRTYAKIPMYYKDGADGYWRKEDATDFPIIHDSPNLVKYNKYDAGTWSLESCNDGYYVCSWICATNNIYEPIIGIIGQVQSESFLNASAQDFGDIASGMPFAEFVLLDKLIFRTSDDFTNTPKAILYSKFKETIDQDTDILGALTKLTFAYNSTAGDRWLDYEYYNVSSFYVPGVVQYKIEIRGISFSNRLDNADVDIEFYVNGMDPANKVYTLEVRDCQWMYNSDIEPIVLNPGDLIRCYVKKQAVAAQSPIIQFEGKVIDATTASGSG